MSYYGGTITVAGRNLITSLLAGETIELTRIMVGSGAMPEGVEPIDMTDLVTPAAEAVSTIPEVDNGILTLTVEYRNDLNGGLKEGFWLREFGIYAKTENTEEILLYYATLGDSPQPVNAYVDNRIDIRRYPVTIALALDADVQVSYSAGSFMTSEEAKKLIDDELSRASEAIIEIVSIKANSWVKDPEAAVDDDYQYYADVPLENCKEKYYPQATLHKSALKISSKAGVCPVVASFDGYLRFWSAEIPEGDMVATVLLVSEKRIMASSTGGDGIEAYELPIASATVLGGVKIGSGVNVAEDGTISFVVPDEFITEEELDAEMGENIANEEEVDNMIEDVFDDIPDEVEDDGIATDEEIQDTLDKIFG